MMRRNKIQQIDKDIQDFDAVSLYPSAMALLDGFLKGRPRRIITKLRRPKTLRRLLPKTSNHKSRKA